VVSEIYEEIVFENPDPFLEARLLESIPQPTME
jgi:hypothetical protein